MILDHTGTRFQGVATYMRIRYSALSWFAKLEIQELRQPVVQSITYYNVR